MKEFFWETPSLNKNIEYQFWIIKHNILIEPSSRNRRFYSSAQRGYGLSIYFEWREEY